MYDNNIHFMPYDNNMGNVPQENVQNEPPKNEPVQPEIPSVSKTRSKKDKSEYYEDLDSMDLGSIKVSVLKEEGEPTVSELNVTIPRSFVSKQSANEYRKRNRKRNEGRGGRGRAPSYVEGDSGEYDY